MALLFTTCGGSDDPVGNDADDPERKAYASKTALVFDGMSMETGLLIDGEQVTEGGKFKYINAFKAGRAYIYSESEENGQTVAEVSVLNEDGYYKLFPEDMTGIKQAVSAAGQYLTDNIIDGVLEQAKKGVPQSGHMEIEGQYYGYEEFYDNDNINSARMRFCFDDKKLVAMVAVSKDGRDKERIAIWLIHQLSGDVDESLFEIPDSYKITNK